MLRVTALLKPIPLLKFDILNCFYIFNKKTIQLIPKKSQGG
jgi:hypothetical protein